MAATACKANVRPLLPASSTRQFPLGLMPLHSSSAKLEHTQTFIHVSGNLVDDRARLGVTGARHERFDKQVDPTSPGFAALTCTE
jgi:hypothetical protein